LTLLQLIPRNGLHEYRKIKARYEKLFQDTLAELIDLDVQPDDVQSDDVLTAELDGIFWKYSEVNIKEYA